MIKKKYLFFAGVLSAIILTGMFLFIIVTAFFPSLFLPAIAIDPVTNANIDTHNRLVLTGTTTLSDMNQIHLTIVRSSPGPVQGAGSPATEVRGFARLLSDTGERNPWKGYADISSLDPGDYLITFVKVTYSENFTKRTESEPLATLPFTLGDERAGPGSLRKTAIADIPFKRINTPNATESPGTQDYITIDTLPEIQTDDVYTLSGTTSLPPGEELLVEVLPYVSGAGIDLVIDPKSQSQMTGIFSSVAGMVSVSDGSYGPDYWTFELETYLLAPGQYIMKVSNNEYNQANMTKPAGGLSSSRVFTVTERSS
ncbi:hypothetical protein [Methanoregula sp.]|uniref:hypothetical protein n=1 Tax=Methanoregula sp. TaxID=2052170 RepID=UPI002618A86D|nr:hypothetical protein [Methanoregula sp.]MDD5142130.1 hypothetical protein [Methanoregula sp.]